MNQEWNPQEWAQTPDWSSLSGGVTFERDILITLQRGGWGNAEYSRRLWDDVAAQIEASPREWRWWVRPKPGLREQPAPAVQVPLVRYYDPVDLQYPPCTLCENCNIGQCGYLPDCKLLCRFDRLMHSLPNVVLLSMGQVTQSGSLSRMLDHMDVLLTISSTSSRTAAEAGVPVLFLRDEPYYDRNRHPTDRFDHVAGPVEWVFKDLLAQGKAAIVDISNLNSEIARRPRKAR